MKIHLVSFATTYKDIGYPDTELRQNRLINSAKKYGIHSFHTWNRQKLFKTNFYKQHKNILDHKIGAGYWLWKPYIILDALEKINDSDFLIYADNSMYFVKDLSPLLRICKENNGILLFKHGDNNTTMSFTQRSTYDAMKLDFNTYKDKIMFGGGIQIYQKNESSITFLKEYLHYCSMPECLIDSNNNNGNLTFITHKHDMSILSLLAAKYNIKGYRVPYQHGNQHKMEHLREEGEFIFGSNYREIDTDSDYPTIFHWDKDGKNCSRPFFQKLNPIFVYYKYLRK
jgi:hypothetical protein